MANSRDQYHARAVATARKFVAAGGRWTGSVLVLAELHGHLLRLRGPSAAREVLRAVTSDPAYAWREVDAELIEAAVSDWLMRFSDQHFSLTDAVTFELMRRERLRAAFAYDADFRTAGYELLD